MRQLTPKSPALVPPTPSAPTGPARGSPHTTSHSGMAGPSYTTPSFPLPVIAPIPGSPAGPGKQRPPKGPQPFPHPSSALCSSLPAALWFPPIRIPHVPQQTNPLGKLEKHQKQAPQSSQVHSRKSFWGPCSAFHPIGMARTHLPPRPRSADAPAGPPPESHLCSAAAAPAPRAPARRFGLTASPWGTAASRSAPWPGPRCCSRRSPAPPSGPAPGASEPRLRARVLAPALRTIALPTPHQ